MTNALGNAWLARKAIKKLSFNFTLHGRLSAVWLQAILTASLQNFARSQRIPVDTLGFSVEVTKGWQLDPAEYSPGCCYIDGLELEAARYAYYHLRRPTTIHKLGLRQ